MSELWGKNCDGDVCFASSRDCRILAPFPPARNISREGVVSYLYIPKSDTHRAGYVSTDTRPGVGRGLEPDIGWDPSRSAPAALPGRGQTFQRPNLQHLTVGRRDTFHTNRAFAYLLDVYSPDRESFVSLPQGADATRDNRCRGAGAEYPTKQGVWETLPHRWIFFRRIETFCFGARDTPS